jgi:hypothetical protein
MIVLFLFLRTTVIQKTFLNLLCITSGLLTTLQLLETEYFKNITIYKCLYFVLIFIITIEVLN